MCMHAIVSARVDERAYFSSCSYTQFTAIASSAFEAVSIIQERR